MKVPGSALLYTLLISLLVSAFLGIVLMGNGLLARKLNRSYARERAEDNLHSGLNHFLRAGFQAGDSLYASLPGLEEDRYAVQSELWGLWILAHVRGSYGQTQTKRSLLMGQSPSRPFRSRLWVSDQGRALSLAGEVQVEGSLYLPKAGVQPARIPGVPFHPSNLSPERIFSSTQTLPPLGGAGIEAIEDSLALLNYLTPLPTEAVLTDVEVYQSWEGSCIPIRSGGSLRLSSGYLEGKCVVFCAGTIEVSAQMKLSHALLFARKIRIGRGFRGALQAFATDSLLVEPDVFLRFPSAIYLLPEAGKPGALWVGENSRIEGAVILAPPPSGLQGRGSLYVSKGSLVRGWVYCGASLDLRGQVEGTVMTREAVLKLPSGVFYNHVKDLRILPLPRKWPSPLLQTQRVYEPAFWFRQNYPEQNDEPQSRNPS